MIGRDHLPHASAMKLESAAATRTLMWVFVLGTVVQGCGPASDDNVEPGEAGGMSGGSLGLGGSPSGGMALAGGSGGRASSGGDASASGGVAGGSASGGQASGGSWAAGGSFAGGGEFASGGDLASGGVGSGGIGSGGVPMSGGAPGVGGGSSAGGPCPVPSYIENDPAPIGWASQGSKTTGGGSADPILVTSLSQFKSEVSGTTAKVIYVQGEFSADNITFGSNKTIIGCSPGAHLKGHLQIGSGSSNLILRNLKISGFSPGNCALDPGFDSGEGCSSGADAISVNGNAHHVWFDHCTVMDGTDGNLDITNDADFVTVSWTKFAYTPRTDNVGSDSTGASGHRYSNLVGGTDSAPNNWPSTIPLNVTWHHNWWADNVVERQPRVRYGRNHIFNNYYSSDTTNYCVRAGIEASILLEGNYFDGVDTPHEFNDDDDEETAFIALGSGDRVNTYASTTGDRSVNGGGGPFTPPYTYQVEASSGVPNSVQAGAGPH